MPLLADAIVREYGDQLRRFVRQKFGLRHADDIYSRVLEKLASGRLPDPERDAMPWLRTVAERAGIDHLRSEKAATGRIIDLRDEAVVDDRLARVEDRLLLEQAMAHLSDVERDAVTGFLWGRSPAEIGSDHGRSPHAIHCLATRARDRVRLILEQVMLPVVAVLAWLRRLARQAQPTPASTMAVEAAFIATLVLVSHALGGSPPTSASSAESKAEQVTHGAAPRADQESVLRSPSDARASVRIADVASPATPHEPGVEIERDDGTVAPRHLGLYQPTVDTPYGRVGGGSIENDCLMPRDFETIPRNVHVYRLC